MEALIVFIGLALLIAAAMWYRQYNSLTSKFNRFERKYRNNKRR